MPHSAATASNSRPMLVVGGAASSPRASDATARQRARRRRPGSGSRLLAERLLQPRARHPPRLADRLLAARHAAPAAGARRARSRRGRPTSSSPPQTVPSVPVARAVVDRADRRARLAVLGQARPRGARGGAGRRRGATASRSSAYLVERYSGCRSWATISGATSNSRSKCATPVARRRAASRRCARSPMWWRDPRARALGEAERALELGAAGEDRRAARRGSARLAGT